VGEARRVGLLSLEDAYVLVALHSSPTDRPSGDAVIRALEGAVAALDAPTVPTSRSLALPPFPDRSSTSNDRSREKAPGARDMPRELTPALSSSGGNVSPRSFSLSAGFILSVLALVVLGGAGAWYALNRRASTDDYAQGVEAYQRDAREVARLAFARAAKAHPDDARAFVFLGRLAREDGNLPAARRFLDAAIRIAPGNATANREMASVLLADGSADVARRFYVRALQLDPTDHLAQGFLACALVRLGRADEAQRWSERAGPGDWSACVSSSATPNGSSSANSSNTLNSSRGNAATPNSGAARAATTLSPARP
jgi:hypothetical protein